MAFDHARYCRTNPKMLKVDENTDPEVELQNSEDGGFDEVLISAVKCYPHLYDTSSIDYRDVIKKENSWIEISKVTNKSPDVCCNRWNRLRESFSKEKRKRLHETKSGSGASRRRGFIYFESMKFIDKFVRSRSSITNVNLRTKLNHSTCSETNIQEKVSNCVQQGKRALEEEEEAVPLQEKKPNVFQPISRLAQSTSPTASTASIFDEASSFCWASNNAANTESDPSLPVSSSPHTIESPLTSPKTPQTTDTFRKPFRVKGKFNSNVHIKKGEKKNDVGIDEFEETLITVNKAIAEHLNATKDGKLANDAETAFCNLVMAELKKMEENEKQMKMQEILQILWRKSNL